MKVSAQNETLNGHNLRKSVNFKIYLKDSEGSQRLTKSSDVKLWKFQPLVNAAELAIIALNNSRNYVNFTQVKSITCQGFLLLNGIFSLNLPTLLDFPVI